MSEQTPKDRYQARRREQRHKCEQGRSRPSDEDLVADYVLELAERFVTAVEKIRDAMTAKSEDPVGSHNQPQAVRPKGPHPPSR